MSELSRRILQRRLELGLSQEELAQRMGYRSKSSITKLEKGVNDAVQGGGVCRCIGDHPRMADGAG